jgi:ligand-binding sensor protein
LITRFAARLPSTIRRRATMSDMAKDLEASRSRPPILRKAAAGLVLIAVAALAIHIVVGLVVAVFWVAVVVAAIVAVLWALKTIVW